MARRERIFFVLKIWLVLFGSVAAFLVCLALIVWSGLGEWLRLFLSEPLTQVIVGVICTLALMAVFSFGMTKLMDADGEGEEKSNG